MSEAAANGDWNIPRLHVDDLIAIEQTVKRLQTPDPQARAEPPPLRRQVFHVPVIPAP